MKYKGYIINRDNLGRLYIYNTKSPYSEDSDHILVDADTYKEAKKIIDMRIQYQQIKSFPVWSEGDKAVKNVW